MSDDDALFREALAACDDAPMAVPPGFADRVVATVAEAPPRPSRAPWGRLAAVAAAAALTLVGWETRARAGDVSVPWGAARAVELSLGRRARAVVEPGTRLRWRTGGWTPSTVDTAELSAGSVFLRVDGGGGFDVRTPYGTVHVTGTCFRVSAATPSGDNDMTRMQRARWFGAGALSVALAVTVYEGHVTLAQAHGRRTLTLSAGERATVSYAGDVTRETASAHTADTTAPPANGSAADADTREPVARAEALSREVARLRAVLTAHHLSPETGEPTGDAGRPRGLDDNGDTDLTPDEWRTLALRGELRFSIPGVGGRDPLGRIAHEAHEMGLRDHEVTAAQEVFRRAEARLTTELRGLYREAAGTDAGSLSLDALQSEIRDKTPVETVGQVDRQLAYERGGLAPAQRATPDMTPYERMMRAVVGYEGELSRELTALLGERDAHDLLHGEHAVGRHSYGRGYRAGDGGAP